MNELFKIYRVDQKEAIRIANSDNQPHNHEFEELIIGMKGKLSHFIDFNEQTFKAPFVSFVTKGKIHRVQPELLDGECELWVLRFKSEFIPETTFQLYNYYHDQANFCITQQRIQKLNTVCTLIYDEMQADKPDLAIVKDLLSALFSMIEHERKLYFNQYNNTLNNQNTTFQSFLSILEDNFRRSEGVNFYAEKLFMSAKSLNAITQNILHQSVSEIIETRKLIEAKNLLFTTEKTVGEIGYELGYSDKAYFTAVFKKKSGQTPTEFREEMKNIIS